MFGRKIPWVLLLGFVLLSSAASAWTIGEDTYAKRYDHTINGLPGTTLSYYTMRFEVFNTTAAPSGIAFYTNGTTAADWRDLRFTDTSNTVYPHWIGSTNATAAVVCVNITSIPPAGTTMRLYYDSDTAAQSSNIFTTFPLGDDFNRADSATVGGNWTEDEGAATSSVKIDANRLNMTTKYYDYSHIQQDALSMSNFILESKCYHPGNAGLGSWGPGVYGYWNWTNWAGIGYKASGGNKYFGKLAIPAGINEGSGKTASTATWYYTRVNFTPTTIQMSYSSDGLTWTQIRSDTRSAYGCVGVPNMIIVGCGYGAGASTNPDLDNSAAGAATYETAFYDDVVVRQWIAYDPTQGSTVTVNEPPTAAFSADVVSGAPPLTVHFTDASTGSPASWAWDFDNDGSTDSTDQNPTHEYAAEGVFTVKLTVTNPVGSDDEIKADYITVEIPYDPPVAGFSANVTEGFTPLAVAFTDSSTGPPTGWAWEITGPGEYYDLDLRQNPNMTFTAPGTYTVSLQVSNPAGNDYENKTEYITVLALPAGPVASFTADAVSGHAPLTVSFTDTSTGSPTSWAWDFDGDAVADSTDQNPTHEYAANGTYTVTLQVSNAGGTDLETKTGYVYVGELTARLLRASFSYSAPIGTAPFSVSFTDTSASNGTYARVWDFGDGATSTEPAPVHEYATAGKYDVELVITSDYTQDKSAARKAVMAYPAAAVSPLPTTTFGAHMTEIMESNWNVSVIGPIIPRAYTDALTPLTGDTGVGNMIFWGIIWVGVFMILFLRQGTPWLAALVGLVVGPGILTFLPPEWAHVGYICLAVTIGCSFFVIALGRFRST